MNTLFQENAPLTLSQYNDRIKHAVNYESDLQGQWVQAETSDVQVRRGHCYLELIEKDPDTGTTVAKAQAVVWANVFSLLNSQFVQVTGQQFASGMKVLVNVSANYHVHYGLKLVINEINPEFTLGDMARQRREILARLEREGVIDMNKSLPWVDVPQRIAVISAPAAAGYDDFINQLKNNAHHLQFYSCLFSAVMQGENTVPSILAALGRINEHIENFDCVVIIRGGGSTSDLNWFDNYDLAVTVAQFPVPVIVGIGHERDVTVLDYVAAMRVKTPTAAAEWLIDRGEDALNRLSELTGDIVVTVRDMLAGAREQLAYYYSTAPAAVKHITETSRLRLNHLATAVPMGVSGRISNERTKISFCLKRILDLSSQVVKRENMRLEAMTDKVTLLSPDNTLKRGYTLTILNGHCVTDASQLKPGDVIETRFSAGTAQAEITHVEQ